MRTLCAISYRKGKVRVKKLRLLRAALLFVLCLFIVSFLISAGSVVSGQSKTVRQVVVSHGDTLWALARAYSPRNMDTREYVELIIEKNQLSEPIIYPGQVLVLP